MTKSFKKHPINVITFFILYGYDYSDLSLKNYFQGN